MKSMLFVFFAMIGFSFAAQAQFGLSSSAGINFSHKTKTNTIFSSTSPKIGHFIGVSPEIQINDFISVLLNVQFSQKGFLTQADEETELIDYRYGYLDLIPEIEFRPTSLLAFGVGFNYGFLLNEKIRVGQGSWVKVADPVPNSVDESDFGLTFKAKANIKQFFVFLRYNMGLKSVGAFTITDEEGQSLGKADFKNKNLQLGFGYRLF